MNYPKQIWDQLKNLTADDLISALKKDGWVEDTKKLAEITYWHPTKKKRAEVHYHPQKTYGRKLLKSLLDDIEWTVIDMKRLKLCK